VKERERERERERANVRRIKKKFKLQGVRVIVYYYYNFFLSTKIIVNKFNKKITMIDTLVHNMCILNIYIYSRFISFNWCFVRFKSGVYSILCYRAVTSADNL